MPWYKAGTVSVALNSNAVTGTGTSFIANSRVGDAFLGPDGRWYEVTNIASNTAMSISPNYLGATAGAGTYSLAPMQGYVKDSADALRTLVNQFGAKLAALGTTGNYDTLPVTKGGTGGSDAPNARVNLGLGSVAIENTVPVAKGGTGGTTPATARTGLGLGIAAVAAILGTMTQGGNEALFQLISNGNGRALRLPDGTLIQTGPIPNFYAIASGATAQAITFPVPFINDQYSLSPVAAPVASNDTYGFVYSSRALSAATLIWKNGVTAQTIAAGFFVAIGRWY